VTTAGCSSGQEKTVVTGDNDNNLNGCSDNESLNHENTKNTDISENSQLSPVTNTKENNLTKESKTMLPMEKAKLIFDYQRIVNGSKDHALVMEYTQGNESFEQLQERLKPELIKLKREK
jgi:hypothetical protein